MLKIVSAEILRLWRQAAEAAGAGFPLELPDGTKRGEWVRPGQEVRSGTRPRVSGLA